MTTNGNTLGLLWPKPANRTLSVAAHHARWRFVEREHIEPAVIVLNPCHQAELQPPFAPLRVLPGVVGDTLTLAGLLVKFDPMISPGHLLVLASDPDEEPVLSTAAGQKNSQHAPVPATKLSSPQKE